MEKTIKAWITVSDFAKTPTTCGEYYTRKKPKHNMWPMIECKITYETNPTKK